MHGEQPPLLFSLKPASHNHVQLVLDEFPRVTHEALAGLPWQSSHSVSCSSEHGTAVYLPTAAQLVQGTQADPFQNCSAGMPCCPHGGLQQAPAARTVDCDGAAGLASPGLAASTENVSAKRTTTHGQINVEDKYSPPHVSVLRQVFLQRVAL